MKKLLLVVCCTLSLTAISFAQAPDPQIRDPFEEPPPLDPDFDNFDDLDDLYDYDDEDEEEKKELKEPPAFVSCIVPPRDNLRPTDRIIFIFDCSTSMGEQNRFLKAMAAIRSIMQTPMDDGRFAMIGFKEKLYIWPGIKEKGVPNYWARLPSAKSIEKANEWLDNISCDSYTNIGPAILKAFEINKEDEKLTIILVTDGNNTWSGMYGGVNNGETPKSVLRKIIAAQKSRYKNGKDKISIFILGVGRDQNIPMLAALAKAGDGAYFTEEKLYEGSCPACIQQAKKYAIMPGAKASYMHKKTGMCDPHREAVAKSKLSQQKTK